MGCNIIEWKHTWIDMFFVLFSWAWFEWGWPKCQRPHFVSVQRTFWEFVFGWHREVLHHREQWVSATQSGDRIHEEGIITLLLRKCRYCNEISVLLEQFKKKKNYYLFARSVKIFLNKNSVHLKIIMKTICQMHLTIWNLMVPFSGLCIVNK